jgi:hypothetical protein
VSASSNGLGRLRQELESAIAVAAGGDVHLTLSSLTVLSAQRDPYRLDTPAGHRDGDWLARAVARFLEAEQRIHLRGLHYKISSASDVLLPSGLPYENNDDCWEWLCEHAAKCARWLGYLAFDRIVDERNEKPFLYIPDPSMPWSTLHQGSTIDVPDLSAALPQLVAMGGFKPRQKYRIVLFGEKTSLKETLLPIAELVGGELLLPTGEASDTMVVELASRIADDGRPAAVLYFSDFDPAGWQMAVSVSRKLQAARTLLYPNIDAQVHPVALTLEQVRRLGLPSSPLKETERRADKWREAWGHDQTEIDAFIALDPQELSRIAMQALKPFYDPTLETRSLLASREWYQAADAAVREHPAYTAAEATIAVIHESLLSTAQELTRAQEAAYEALYQVQAPEIVPPITELTDSPPRPLFWTKDDYAIASRRLIAHKALEDLNDLTTYVRP